MHTLSAQRLNWAWVLAYTAGLNESQKCDRRDEIRSDMFDQQACATSAGEALVVQERQVLSRMARGLVGDLLWRWEAGRQAERIACEGGAPPLPWFSSVFFGAVIAFGAVSSTLAAWLGDSHVAFAMLAMLGAGMAWFGLHLATHRHWGPVLLAVGTACVAWCLWWTFVIPVLSVVVATSGVRRAQRIERLVDG